MIKAELKNLYFFYKNVYFSTCLYSYGSPPPYGSPMFANPTPAEQASTNIRSQRSILALRLEAGQVPDPTGLDMGKSKWKHLSFPLNLREKKASETGVSLNCDGGESGWDHLLICCLCMMKGGIRVWRPFYTSKMIRGGGLSL